MTKTTTRAEFLATAERAFRISEQVRGLREDRLVMLPGSGACVPVEEAEELKSSLAGQGLQIVDSNAPGTATMYLPDARHYVHVAPK